MAQRMIKFRGKSTVAYAWVYGSLVYYNKRSLYPHIVSIDGIYIGNYAVKPETVGQFTGLHDFNGQEIYEGDIISVNKPDSLRYAVKYDDSAARFKMVYGDYFTDSIEQDKINMTKMVVIGNVIDNPKLLEGDEQ